MGYARDREARQFFVPERCRQILKSVDEWFGEGFRIGRRHTPLVNNRKDKDSDWWKDRFLRIHAEKLKWMEGHYDCYTKLFRFGDVPLPPLQNMYGDLAMPKSVCGLISAMAATVIICELAITNELLTASGSEKNVENVFRYATEATERLRKGLVAGGLTAWLISACKINYPFLALAITLDVFLFVFRLSDW